MSKENGQNPRGVRVHALALLIISAAAAIVAFGTVIANSRAQRNFSAVFLDVGQGDSSLVLLPGGAVILIDAGPANKRSAEELSKILPKTRRTIDLVVISHPQLDHAGGLPEVIKRNRVGAVAGHLALASSSVVQEIKERLKTQRIGSVRLIRGDKIRFGGSLIRVLYPPEAVLARAKDLNETSLVLLVESAGMRLLFTGDINAAIGNKIRPASATVLKVPHHGSKYGLSENLIRLIHPKIAVIEVGKNTYGHPAPEILRIIGKYGACILRTDQNGTIKITGGNNAVRVTAKNAPCP